jgi:hypothetical protein
MGNGTQSQASPEGEEAGWLSCAFLIPYGTVGQKMEQRRMVIIFLFTSGEMLYYDN